MCCMTPYRQDFISEGLPEDLAGCFHVIGEPPPGVDLPVQSLLYHLQTSLTKRVLLRIDILNLYSDGGRGAERNRIYKKQFQIEREGELENTVELLNQDTLK